MYSYQASQRCPPGGRPALLPSLHSEAGHIQSMAHMGPCRGDGQRGGIGVKRVVEHVIRIHARVPQVMHIRKWKCTCVAHGLGAGSDVDCCRRVVGDRGCVGMNVSASARG
jgi:hypothetical protein